MNHDFSRIFAATRSIAVLGAHHESWRPAFYVPDYLFHRGFRIFPVNPALSGETLWGEPVQASLLELPEPVQMVVVFRHSALLLAHLPEILGMRSRPAVVWLQTGIVNDEFARMLEGIEVVQDRCAMVVYRLSSAPDIV